MAMRTLLEGPGLVDLEPTPGRGPEMDRRSLTFQYLRGKYLPSGVGILGQLSLEISARGH